jgi:hypothetical protein
MIRLKTLWKTVQLEIRPKLRLLQYKPRGRVLHHVFLSISYVERERVRAHAHVCVWCHLSVHICTWMVSLISSYSVKKSGKVPVLNYALYHEGIWGSGCIDQCFLHLSTSWRWVVIFMPRPFYAQGKVTEYPLDRLGGPQNRPEQYGEERMLGPSGTRTPTPYVIQSVASHYTDFTIAAPIYIQYTEPITIGRCLMSTYIIVSQ